MSNFAAAKITNFNLNIAVNTRFLISNKMEGIGGYTYEVVRRMVLAHPEHEFLFIFDRQYDPKFVFAPNITPVVVYPSARHPILWYIWFELRLPYILKKHQVDVFFSPDSYLSCRSKIPTVMTVHDIIPLQYLKGVPKMAGLFYQYFLPKYLQRADQIVTISHYVKNSILEKNLAKNDKIKVIWNGCSEIFKPNNVAQKAKIKAKYSQNCDFFFYTGAIHPRKNVDGLINAFDRYKSKTLHKTKLLIAGRFAWETRAVTQAYEQSSYREDIVFLGYLPQEDLVALMASAMALVLISINEGFGLPVAEAYNCDTPVICSNSSALAEVGEGAALLVNPMDFEEVKEAMVAVSNSEKRWQVIENQRIRRSDFSWDKAAEEVWASIIRCK
jgi:glycosyltransferase involved in cell wall biosynthesis